MKKELKFQSQISCKQNGVPIIYKSNELTLIVLPKPIILDYKKEPSCLSPCKAPKSYDCIPKWIYYFIFFKII